MSKPDLSVAIIFKNEIRCLERCLKSLQPLRERLSLQIVMADTGSDDGSRAVAEQYADVLFDFPWINDFAAARNAVLDRCKGKWVLVVDCDEWLDTDMDELADFLLGKQARAIDAALLTIRNYGSVRLDSYGDSSTMRLLNMASHPRYQGAIHENPVFSKVKKRGLMLRHTILHHDGYVMLNDGSEAGVAKRTRNLSLLREELKREPNNLRIWGLYLESISNDSAYPDELRRAVALVKEKPKDWELFGPPILRFAIWDGCRLKMPEFDQWVKDAFDIFPESYYIRVDGNFMLFTRAHESDDYEGIVRWGEAYLRACADMDRDKDSWVQLRYGTLQRKSEKWESIVACCVSHAYYQLKRYDRAITQIKSVRWNAADAKQTRSAVMLLNGLWAAGEDTSTLAKVIWEGICTEIPSKAISDERKWEFLRVCTTFFVRPDEDKAPYRMLLPLRGKCILGDAAALLCAETPEEADDILTSIDDLTEIPASAFVHALKLGADFPISGKTLTTDQIAALAEKLLIDPSFLREAAKFAASAAQTEQEVLWAYALAKVALNQTTASLLAEEKE